MKTIYTTSQVARICKVAPRTVSKWFDSGRLRGYRVPGSQDRRIPREHLIRFMEEHQMPLGDLVVGIALTTGCEDLSRVFAKDVDIRIEFVNTGFEVGIAADICRCVVVDLDYFLTPEDRIRVVMNLQKAGILVFGLSCGEPSPCEIYCRRVFRRGIDSAIIRNDIRNEIGAA